jgi:hypothetical protein
MLAKDVRALAKAFAASEKGKLKVDVVVSAELHWDDDFSLYPGEFYCTKRDEENISKQIAKHPAIKKLQKQARDLDAKVKRFARKYEENRDDNQVWYHLPPI